MRPVSGLLLMLACGGLVGCDNDPPQRAASDFGGNPAHGAVLIASLGCGSCHAVPGIAEAHGRVGPPLAGIGDRTTIAGVLTNTPYNMIAWLRTPQRFVPGNFMPNMEINEHDAKDIAAYLYTLR